MQTTGAVLLAVYRCGTTGASKNAVEEALTSVLPHSRLRRRLVASAATRQVDDWARALVRVWSIIAVSSPNVAQPSWFLGQWS